MKKELATQVNAYLPNIILGCQEQHNSLFCIQLSVLLHNNAETINGLHHVDADTDNVDLSRP